MKLKQKWVVAAIAVAATAPGLAQTSAGTFTATDIALLFEQDTKPLQLAVLSEQEMKATEGACWGKCVIWGFNPALLGFGRLSGVSLHYGW